MRKINIEEEIAAIRESAKRHARSPEAARAFLRRVGIIDENGNLTPEYTIEEDEEIIKDEKET